MLRMLRHVHEISFQALFLTFLISYHLLDQTPIKDKQWLSRVWAVTVEFLKQ